jgi:Raf kinase inhibitor-like YbhB/YbcL family protein
MRHEWFVFSVVAALAVGGCSASNSERRDDSLLDPNSAPATLNVTLPTVVGGVITQQSAFNGMGCTGQNQSIAVSWTGAPEKTQSYVLIMHDPDAPTGVGFFHWLVANLPKDTTSLPVGASVSGLPSAATQTTNDFGGRSYGGPCPPPGPAHRYFVTVYALDVPKLEVPPTASGALLRFMVRDHTLALGRAVATYQRP